MNDADEESAARGLTRRGVLATATQGMLAVAAGGLAMAAEPGPAEGSGQTSALQLDRKATAVLALDFQTVTVGMDAMTSERDVVAKASAVLDAARAAGLLTILVHIDFRPGYPEVSPRNRMFRYFTSKDMFLASDPDSRIDPRIGPRPGDVLVRRPRVNPFYHSDLQTVLESNGIETLVMFGIATNWVVEAAARHAADADYGIVVLEDCCAAPSVAQHDASVGYILSALGDVRSSKDFITAMA